MSQSTNSKNEKLVILKNKDYYDNLYNERFQIIEIFQLMSELAAPTPGDDRAMHNVCKERFSNVTWYLSEKLMSISNELEEHELKIKREQAA